MNVAIKQQQINLGSIEVLPQATKRERNPKPQVVIKGETYHTTDRFWNSLYSRYGIGANFFKYFSHEEVFQRVIQANNKSTQLTMTVEENEGRLRALALVNSEREVASYNGLLELFKEHGGKDVNYSSGIVKAVFQPPSGQQALKIGPDEYINNYVLQVPVDGYGDPKIYLSLLRLLCTNGVIGYGSAFESGITAKHDPLSMIERALNSYDNDQGYDQLASRIERAQMSYASFNEVVNLEGILLKTESGAKHIDEYRELTGFVQRQYGIANPQSIPTKKQMLLPTKVRVSELIDYATEIATHHARPKEAELLHASIGSLICSDYDLEGSAEKSKEFKDLHVKTNRKAKSA